MKLNIGNACLKMAKHSYDSNYEMKLYAKLKYLNPDQDANELLKNNIARKINFMLLLIAFLCLNARFIFLEDMITYAIIAVFIFCMILPDMKLNDMIKTRRKCLELSFYNYINKLILLISAGINITSAIINAANTNKKNDVFFIEISKLHTDISNNYSISAAFESFVRRCNIPSITTFSSVLVQNIKKGNDELIPILKMQAISCRENRKSMARKLGEEAKAKLIFPSTLIFLAIVIMIIYPALVQFNV